MAPFFDLCPSSPKQYFLQTSHTKSLLLLSRPSPKGYQKRVKKKTPSRTLQKTAWSTKKPLKQTPKVFQKSLNFGSLFFWPLLGPTWASLVPSWPVWVPILPPSSPILDHLGTNLGLSCALLVPILPHLAANLSQLGPFGAHLAPSWSIFWPTCRFTLTCAGPSCLCRAFLLNSWLPASTAKLLGGGDVAPGALYNKSYASLLKL